MSNTVVGTVYQHIIEDVISTSRVDFEENGVEEGVLDDLRKGWQKKLSQFKVAQFPWDPKEPEGGGAAGPAIPSAAAAGVPGVALPAQTPSVDTGYAQSAMGAMPPQGMPMPLPMPSMEPVMAKQEASLDHGIKNEPDSHGSGLAGISGVSATPVPAPSLPNFPPLPMGGGNAAARAVQQLQSTFGPRAAASINAIHSGMAHSNQQQNGQRQGAMGIAQQRAMNAQQYRAQVAAAQTAAQLNGANGVSRSQVDGGNDDDGDSNAAFFQGVLMQQRTAGEPPVELGRVEIDNMLHEQMAQRAQQMEGGGLMIPLRQANKRTSRAVSQKSKTTGGAMGQTDGVDDDEDTKNGILDDEDAINSDLDDPEDDKEDDDDEDDVMGPIMLCVYDKVQRVKNKWKCTLKDGVLTVNGKEYVFHKATGEYEW